MTEKDTEEIQAAVDSAIGALAEDDDNDITRENTFVGEPMTVAEFGEMMQEIVEDSE